MIKYDGKEYKYYDKKFRRISEGDLIKWDDGRIQPVLKSTEGYLGTDATNPSWVASGKAEPGEWGVYPFSHEDTTHILRVAKALKNI